MNEEGSLLARLDFDSYRPSQKQFHEGTTPEDAVESRFFYNKKKFPWSAKHWEVCTASSFNKSVKYHINHNFHILLCSVLRIKLPRIEVAEKWTERVRVCWPINVGLNIVEQANLSFGTKPAQTINDIWLNIYLQYFVDKQDLFSEMIGNRKGLQDWKENHEEAYLNIPQPWCYNPSQVCSLKLLLCKNSPVTHDYRFRDVKSLLRIQMLKDGKWEYIAYNKDYFVGTQEELNIPTPELWAGYSYIDNIETTVSESLKKEWIYSISIKENSKIIPSSMPVRNRLQTDKECSAIFWVAQNDAAKSNKQYSNFTNNPEDIYNGDNPFKTMNLLYGEDKRVRDKPADLSSELEMYYNAKSRDIHKGYNMHAIAYNIHDIDHDIGVVMKELNAEIVLDLKEDENEVKQIYNIYVVCQVKVELEYKNGVCHVN